LALGRRDYGDRAFNSISTCRRVPPNAGAADTAARLDGLLQGDEAVGNRVKATAPYWASPPRQRQLFLSDNQKSRYLPLSAFPTASAAAGSKGDFPLTVRNALTTHAYPT
jgi:hypothetical protein